jgi:hypothetical protein
VGYFIEIQRYIFAMNLININRSAGSIKIKKNMKKTIIYTMLASIICLSSNHVVAQDLIPKKNETTEKWGFVNKQGKVVISYKYEIAGEFSEGLAIVAIGNKAGYINKTGKVVIPLQYDGVFPFKNGFAVVMIDSKRGLIDKTGKEIIPCLYQKIEPLGDDGYSVVFEDKMGYFDKTGKQHIPFEYASLAITKDGQFAGQTAKGGYWKMIDKEGNVVE